MKWSIPALGLMFVGGVMVGFAANPTQPLRAADRPPVYSVYEANVIDPEGYKSNFLKVVAPKLERHGIKYLVRGKEPRMANIGAINRAVAMLRLINVIAPHLQRHTT